MKILAMMVAILFAMVGGGYVSVMASVLSPRIGKVCGFAFAGLFLACILGKFGII